MKLKFSWWASQSLVAKGLSKTALIFPFLNKESGIHQRGCGTQGGGVQLW